MTAIKNTPAATTAKVAKPLNIKTAIKAIAKSTENLRTNVQNVGVAIIAHAKEHGDVAFAGDLATAISPRLRPDLIAWFGKYSPIVIQKDGETGKMKARQRKHGSDGYVEYNLDGAKANMWYELEKADKPLETLTRDDLAKALLSTIAYYERVQAGESKANVKLGFNPKDDIASVKKLVADMRAPVEAKASPIVAPVGGNA